MYRIGCALFAVVLLDPGFAHAARIYQLVNYPALQEGHTLAGTITTTDDAPDDSVLEAAEILHWQWTITGPNNLSADGSSPTQLEGITITTNSIEFPSLSTAVLSLRNQSQFEEPLPALAWFHRFNDDSGMFEPTYLATVVTDVSRPPSIWSSNLAGLATSSWIVATIVPEPSCCLLAVLGTMSVLFIRRLVTVAS